MMLVFINILIVFCFDANKITTYHSIYISIKIVQFLLTNKFLILGQINIDSMMYQCKISLTYCRLGVLVHACNSITQEADEANRS
jgi:hypothetical protein